MTDVYKGTSGFGNYLLITRANAERLTANKNGLKFYSTDTISEFDQVFHNLPPFHKLELSNELNKSGDHLYEGFLRREFEYGFLQLYVTGNSHFTSPSFLMRNSEKCDYYLAPAIDVLQYPAVNYMDFSNNENGINSYIEEVNINDIEAASLVDAFYDNTRNIYSGRRIDGPIKNPTGLQQLKNILEQGDAVIIQKHKLMYVPFENVISVAVGVGALKSRTIGDKCVEIDVFIVKCEHYPKSRKFQLDVINSAANFNGNQHVLQVVAQSDKPETVTIEYDKATCIHDDTNCPSIVVDGGEYLNQVITKSPFKLSAVPNISKFPEDSSGNPFMSLAKFIADVFIPSNSIVNPNIYTIKTQGCGDISNNIAEVHCYPTMGWSGEIYAGRTAEREEKFSFQYDANNQLETAALPVDQKTSFTYGGEFSLGINGRNFKPIKYSRSDDSASGNFILRRIEDTVSGLLDNIDLIGKIGDKIGITPAKFIIKPPNVAIGGDMKAVEHPTSGVIDYEGSVYLKAKPLLSLDIEIDFLNILIILAGGATTAVGGPAAAKFIIEMREKFSKGVGDSNSAGELKGDFYAKLTIKGSAAGSLIWTSKPGDTTVVEQGIEESNELDEDNKRVSYTKGELKGQVGITLEAGAHIEGRLFKISVRAGIGIGVSGATGVGDPVGLFVKLAASSEENKPTLSGNVEFSGMQIYYIKFAEMSRKEGVNAGKKDRGKRKAGGDLSDTQTLASSLEDARTLYTVIEAKKLWEFGEGDAPTSQALNQV